MQNKRDIKEVGKNRNRRKVTKGKKKETKSKGKYGKN